ncbi:MAG: DMT family transporter [Kofleriaceae bacterium]|nr:DMT family transporter [Kofleriaceae bacterium]
MSVTAGRTSVAGSFMVVGAAASWGTWSLFLRPTGLPATVTGPLIFLVMGLVCLPWCWRLPRAHWTPRIKWLLVANGVFDALNVLAFFSALEHTTVAIAVLTHYLAPCFIALAAPYIDRQRTPGALPAAAVALAGLGLVLTPWHTSHNAGNVGLGALLGAGSAICYAGNVFVVGRVALVLGPLRAMGYHALIAGVLLLPLALADISLLNGSNLALLSTAAITIGAISGVLFVAGLERIGSARAAVLTYAEPLVAVVIGVVYWHEAASGWAVLGGLLIAGAGLFTVIARPKPQPSSD